MILFEYPQSLKMESCFEIKKSFNFDALRNEKYHI